MASTAHHVLTALKSPQLKRLGFLTGSHTGGTKSQIIGNLTQGLRTPRLAACVVVGRGKTNARLLSIDMGIRNLAYCVLEVSDVHKFSNDTKSPATLMEYLHVPTRLESMLQHLRVTSWKRVVVNENTVTAADEQVNGIRNASTSISKVETTAFEPIAYAKLAYELVARLLRAYQPTTIIIERQRWRSGGASSVLEWTIRVNMFEGMIHSALETLRQQWHSRKLGSRTTVGSTSQDEEHGEGDVLATLAQFPDVYSASPKRVFDYWADCEAGESGKYDGIEIAGKGEEKRMGMEGMSKELVKPRKVVPSKSKAQKHLKIGVVESWLRGVERCPGEDLKKEAASMLECTGDAASVRDAFLRKLSKQKGRGIRARKSQQEQGPGPPVNATVDKLDDLADCLLQGVTWVQWARNRQAMSASLGWSSSAELGVLHSLSDEQQDGTPKPRRARSKRG